MADTTKSTKRTSTGDSSISVPDLVEFENDDAFVLITESKSAEESVDELQALNTALCFLCSINADVTEVEAFLSVHANALLLEGAGNLPEESARYIVQEQMQRCQCFSPQCNKNRQDILTSLERGFEYYQTIKLTDYSSHLSPLEKHHKWALYADKLTLLEHDIRKLRTEELTMRSRLLETAVEVRAFRDELTAVQKYNDQHHPHSSSSNYPHHHGNKTFVSAALTTMLTSCTSSFTKRSELFARMSVLEYQVGVASLNLSSVEREHKLLLNEIRNGRRVQFALLKAAFDGVQRHVCLGAGSNTGGTAAGTRSNATATTLRAKHHHHRSSKTSSSSASSSSVCTPSSSLQQEEKDDTQTLLAPAAVEVVPVRRQRPVKLL